MEDRSYLNHVLSFYNRYARYYDLGEFVRRGTRRKVVDLSGWKSGERVLDI